MTQVRTRFAPSPTGFIHLGNARTALFAYLFAKHHNGQFILRIEDTDQDRLTEGAEDAIYRVLEWLGLNWDEGPKIGGPVGPYKCSDRYPLYEEHLKRIRKMARVYRCFCSSEQLDQDRKLLSSQNKVLKYVGRCRSISDVDSETRAKTEKFVWRLQVDETAGPVKIQDEIRGDVAMNSDLIGDFIIFRSTGIPVFLFANAVDDALMEISHVTRGEDHLSNTFRQVLIFKALGYKVPLFAHLPMIGDSDGGKFSKRAGSLAIEKLKDEGFLAEGLVNYLALLGWSPGDTSEHGEKFTKQELIERFTLDRVNKSRALYDPTKLRFLNAAHIHDLSTEELVKRVPSVNPAWSSVWPQAVELIRHDISTLSEIHKVDAFLEEPVLQDCAVASEILKKDQTSQMLEKAIELVEGNLKSGEAVDQALQSATKQVGKDLGLKGKQLFFPFRLAITGKDAGPELGPLVKILGPEKLIQRLKLALEFSKAA